MKTRLGLIKYGGLVWECFSVALCSVVLGAGTAFILANFAFSGMDMEEIVTWSHAAAFQGTWIGLLCGLVLYYGLFRRQVRFLTVSHIVTIPLLIGAPAGVLVQRTSANQAGWLSLLIAPLVAFVVAFRIKKGSSAPAS